MNNFYAALEIGTTRTVLAVGEAKTGGSLRLVSHAEIPSVNVRKSQILDIKQASQSIRSVLSDIEKKQDAAGSHISVGNVFLAVSGQHVQAVSYPGTAQVEGATVDENAINEALRSSRRMVLPKERELLDIIDQDYMLDRLGGIAKPRGMSGRILQLNTLQIHADRDRIQNARTAAESAHLEIREPLFACTCAADAVLEDYEKKNGALVLDLGGGSTGYAVYSDGYAVATGVIGVGGDHVTNDIAHAFQTTNAQAEQLKTTEASALVGSYASDRARVRIVGSSTLMENRTISRRALDTVVNARIKELLAVLRERLEEHGLLHRLHAGVVLTGGGASLRDIDTLVEQELLTNVRRGRPLNIAGLEDEAEPWTYATITGALLYAHRNYEEHSILDGLFGRFFAK